MSTVILKGAQAEGIYLAPQPVVFVNGVKHTFGLMSFANKPLRKGTRNNSVTYGLTLGLSGNRDLVLSASANGSFSLDGLKRSGRKTVVTGINYVKDIQAAVDFPSANGAAEDVIRWDIPSNDLLEGRLNGLPTWAASETFYTPHTEFSFGLSAKIVARVRTVKGYDGSTGLHSAFADDLARKEAFAKAEAAEAEALRAAEAETEKKAEELAASANGTH